MLSKVAFFIFWTGVFLFFPTRVYADDVSLHVTLQIPGFFYAAETSESTVYLGKLGGIEAYDVGDAEPQLLGTYQDDGCSFKALKKYSGFLFSSQNEYDCGLGFMSFTVEDAVPHVAGNKLGLSQVGSVVSIDVVGQYAYLAKAQEGLVIVDISGIDNKTSFPPRRWGSGSYTDIEVVDGVAFITDISGVLYIVDVSNAGNPQLISSYQYPRSGGAVISNFLGLQVLEQKVYIAGGGEGLVVVDISQFQNPVLVENIQTPGYARDVLVKGDYAFIADTNSGVSVVDIAQTGELHIETVISTIGRIEKVSIAQDTLIAVGPNSVVFADIEGIGQTTEPFLDLPWEYERLNYSFTRAALSMNSFFDHSYPLVSANISEPHDHTSDVTTYLGRIQDVFYSSHDGYDYGTKSGARYGEWVVAAGSGCATYKKTAHGGNTLRIDHKNGYQSRYLHLQLDNLITTDTQTCVEVSRGDRVGKVGFSGNVIPAGEGGSHLHFMVIEDKNKDGNFDDNIPDGLVDPFGWQSDSDDPWENYSFVKNGQTFYGNRSNYLWIKDIYGFSGLMTNEELGLTADNYSVNFPSDPSRTNGILNVTLTPVTSLNSQFYPLLPGLEINLHGDNALPVTQLSGSFRLAVNTSGMDILNFTNLTLFSSTNGVEWVAEETHQEGDEIYANINHLSHFVLGGEKVDEIAPETTCALSGQAGETGWYRSDVAVSCTVTDDLPTSGIEYTLYRANGNDWKTYSEPLIFSDEGEYLLEFLSSDKGENIETIKSSTFHIDKQFPELILKTIPNAPDFILEGKDEYLKDVEVSEVSTKTTHVNILDTAGNLSKFILQRYPDSNYISIVKSEKNGVDNTFVQNFLMYATKVIDEERSINNQVFYSEIDGHFKLVYDSYFDTTRIMKRMTSSGWDSQTQNGKYYLTVNTRGGDLYYEYGVFSEE